MEVFLVLTPDEIARFYGLNEFDVKLYLIIRKYMDGQTHITGIKRHVSWQGLYEEMYIERSRGRPVNDPVTLKKVRCSIKRLERIGFIDILSSEKQLIFRCKLATSSRSVQKNKGRLRADLGTTSKTSKTITTVSPDTISTIDLGQTQNANKGIPLYIYIINNIYISEMLFYFTWLITQLERSKKPKKTPHTFPDNFIVSDKHRDYAKANQLPAPDSEFDQFKDYHSAKGSKFLDWDAAFRTWLRNAKKFQANKPANGYQHSRFPYQRNENKSVVQDFIPSRIVVTAEQRQQNVMRATEALKLLKGK